jgi:formate dehydrogenase iron-sulfur subunit
MIRVYVPRDSAARSVGADEVAFAIEAGLRERGVDAEVVRNGSRGMLWLEPLVEVETPAGRVGYGPVTLRDVAGLLDGGLPDGAPHSLSLGLVDEIEWLASQQRVTFARVGVIDPLDLDDYRAHGGLRGLERAVAITSEEIVADVLASGLRGRGGAGFPAGIKWRTVLEAQAEEKYVCCNADEGDSGTFADRMLMEGDPFTLLEGMAIAGLATGATQGLIYVRSEYPDAIAILRTAIDIARVDGWLGPDVMGSGRAFDIRVVEGAGSYVCGEETAMLESLEGKRGMVRPKPPIPALQGLFGKPTLVNNVLTLAAVPGIMADGAAAYQALGMERSRGTQVFQLAGNIARGGIVELAFGVTLGERGHPIGSTAACRAGGRAAGCLPPRRHARRPDGLRSARRRRRPPRPRRHRGLRRHGRHGGAGALRHGVLRGGVVRQVHALSDRVDPRRRSHRPDHRRHRPRSQSDPARGPLHHHDRRVAVRHGRPHAPPGAQCSGTLP